MKKTIIMSILVLFLISISSCTKQNMVKQFGGTETIMLEPNKKLVMATWKESNLWFLTRPMNVTDVAETYEFSESSQFGVFEGTLIIKETKTFSVSDTSKIDLNKLKIVK